MHQAVPKIPHLLVMGYIMIANNATLTSLSFVVIPGNPSARNNGPLVAPRDLTSPFNASTCITGIIGHQSDIRNNFTKYGVKMKIIPDAGIDRNDVKPNILR